MILRTRHGNVELRSEFGHSSDLTAPRTAALSAAGVPVTQATALGIPAVANVIRSPAEILASFPFIVYEKGEINERAEKSWQWDLLHEQPSDECNTFEFFYDVALSLEAAQNAFIQKAKFRGRVFEMYVLDPQRVTCRRDRETGEKLFDVYVSDGQVQRNLTTKEILHIRGYSSPGALCGVSLLWQHRDPIGASIAMQKFEGDYFRNSGNVPFVFEMQQGNETQAQALLDSYLRQHSGPGKQWNPVVVWGGTSVKPMPLSMRDAAYAEVKKLSVEDVCQIWGWPPELLGLSNDASPTDYNTWTTWFLKFYFLWRLRRIERAFASDPDLFRGSNLFGEFLTAGLERADIRTRYESYLKGVQAGWLAQNEVRALENLPPKEGGDEIQQTPVGGAPNPATSNGSVDEESAREALRM